MQRLMKKKMFKAKNKKPACDMLNLCLIQKNTKKKKKKKKKKQQLK